MKTWDAFVSHASEDKETVALPLTEALGRSGLKVWLDRFEMRVGDSLREKIDEGLAESRFGIVLLSKAFFKKRWPRQELNGLFAVEDGKDRVILPVWHEVDQKTVARHSPILADRLAVDTQNGIPAVAKALSAIILSSRRKPVALAGRFVELLQRGPNPIEVSTFIIDQPSVLSGALGHFRSISTNEQLCSRPPLGEEPPDLSVGKVVFTRGDCNWTHFLFISAADSFVDELDASVRHADRLLSWLGAHGGEATNILPNPPHSSSDPQLHSHRVVIVAGRREEISDQQKTRLRALKGRALEVRSYDWLIEACVWADKKR